MNMVFLYDRRFVQQNVLDSFADFILTTQPVTGCSILMRWGNMSGNDNDAGIVLNRQHPLINCLDKEKAFEILKLNRVRRPLFVNPKSDSRYPIIGKRFDPASGQQQHIQINNFHEAQASDFDFFVEHVNTVKKYNIYIFNLSIYFLTKKTAVRTHTHFTRIKPQWIYEEIPVDLDEDAQKAGLLAKRACHVLGLDFGEVHAGIDVYGRPLILDISPVPSLPEPAIPLFRRQVDNFAAKWKTTAAVFLHVLTPPKPEPVDSDFAQTTLFDIPDPDEDILTQSDSFPASSDGGESNVLLGADPEFMLRNTITGQITYPSEFFSKEGSLGYDDRSERRQGILFPLAEIRPAPDYCPIKLTENIRAIMFQALSLIPPHIEWLAGSLHFERYQIGGHIHFSNIEVNARLLRALDNYLGIPVMLVEDPATALRRRKQYGWLGSIRCKPHGGFEYRTPASWLVTPEITAGCLCLAKIVAEEYRKLPKDFLSDPNMQKAFYQSKKYYFYDLFNEIWQDIEKTSLFAGYARYLTPLTDLINRQSHWDETIDLRKSWGLL